MGEVLEFELNLSHSPLAAKSVDEIDRFIHFAEVQNRLHERKAIIVTLKANHHFIDLELLHELKNEIYFDELFGRIIKLQYLAQHISRSSHFWIFVHANDCLGALFDLALAFDYRFCFNSRALVGFPSIAGSLLPFVGPFIQRYGRSSRRRGRWIKRSVLRASDAVDVNLLNFVTDHSDWRTDVVRWVYQFLSDEKSLSSDPLSLEMPNSSEIMKEALDRIAQDDLLAKARPGRETFEGTWSLASQVRGTDHKALYAAIAYMCSRTLVSRDFIKWAERHLSTGGSLYWLEPERSKIAYVDMEFLAPPIKPLVRLIESGFKVIFCSSDERRLKEGVELMYARFERHLTKIDAQDLWRNGIAWYTGDITSVNEFPVIQWLANDRVRINTIDGELVFLRFLGNRGSAECGWAELSLDDLNSLNKYHQSYEIARLMSDGIVKSCRLVKGQVELSTAVRSFFLEEILTVASTLQGATGKLLPALRDAGWGYVADDNSWEYFLRAREETYRIPASAIRVGSISVNSEMWHLGVWREGREGARQGSKKDRGLWNPVSISRHFATYAAMIAEQVCKSGLVRDAKEADRFVSECLGFPANLGTPLTFLESLGRRRFTYYCQRFWPRYQEKK